MRPIILVLVLAACQEAAPSDPARPASAAGEVAPADTAAPQDLDGDGYDVAAGDCDDTDPDIHPGAEEICDGAADEDCDGAVDEGDAAGAPTWYIDGDGDSWGQAVGAFTACAPPAGVVAVAGDCDDADPLAYPGAPETCDGVDSDCDGVGDMRDTDATGTAWRDADGDGWGDPAASVEGGCALPEGYVGVAGDCDDGDAATWPGAPEACDGVPNDCDDPGGDEEGAVSLDGAAAEGLEAALAGARDGSEILLCPGLHVGAFEVSADVTLRGRDGAAVTTIEGDGSGSALFLDGAALTIEGITVLGGSGSSSPSTSGYVVGGGISAIEGGPLVAVDCAFWEGRAELGGCVMGSPAGDTFRGVTFEGCYANSAGGGLFLLGGEVEGATFSGNEAWYSGGAVFSELGAVSYTDVTFEGNRSDWYGAAVGVNRGMITMRSVTFDANEGDHIGAIYATAASLDVAAARFTDNQATYGPAILTEFTDVTLEDLYVTGSRASYAPIVIERGSLQARELEIVGNAIRSYGGALELTSTTADIADALFHDNGAPSYGGGVVCAGSALSMTDVEILDSEASSYGGAIRADGCDMTLTRARLEGNHSGTWGGALSLTGSALWMVDSSLADNTCDYYGGAIDASDSDIWIEGGQVVRSSDPSRGAIYMHGTTLEVTSADFGEGADDNSPSDISIGYGEDTYDYGARATFRCDDAGCE